MGRCLNWKIKSLEICVKWQVDFLMMKKSKKFQMCFSLGKVF